MAFFEALAHGHQFEAMTLWNRGQTERRRGPSGMVGDVLLTESGLGLAVGGWFLAHRHGRLRGFVDANRNGVDDRAEAVGIAGVSNTKNF